MVDEQARAQALTPSAVLGVAAAVLVVLTSAVVIADGPLPGEVGLILALQELPSPFPALAEGVWAVTGTEGNLVVGAVGAASLLARRRRGVSGAMVVWLVAMLVVQPVSKVVVDRDRPSEPQVEVRAEHDSRSYPSGHALGTATVWGTAAWVAWRRRGLGRAAVTAMPIAAVAVASGILGVHWASDVVAGTIVGLIAAWLAGRCLLGEGRLARGST